MAMRLVGVARRGRPDRVDHRPARPFHSL